MKNSPIKIDPVARVPAGVARSTSNFKAVPHELANNLSIFTGPALLALFSVLSFLGASGREIWRSWMVCGGSLLITTGLTTLGKAIPVWPAHASFPSGHEGFAVVVGTCIAMKNGAALPYVMVALLVLSWALVAAKWHDPVDVAGGAVIAMLVTIGINRFAVWLSPEEPKELPNQ